MLASSSNSSEWNNDDKWSSQVQKSGEMSRTSTERPVSNELVIDIYMDSDTATESDLSWKSRCWTVLQKIQCKTLTNVLWFGECLCFRHWKHLYSWERITQTIYIPSKIQVNSQFKEDVRDIWTVDIGTIGWDFWSVSISWESSLWKQLSVSRMQRFMYSQSLCYLLERWIITQHHILFVSDKWNGSKIHHNTELWTQLTEKRLNSSDIFPRIHFIGICPWSPKVREQYERPRTIPRTKYLHVDASYGELKTVKRNEMLIPRLCLHLQKDFQQDVGHSSDLDQTQSGIQLSTKDHEENGTESLNWWWSSSGKADTQFSEPRVHCPEERSKAKVVGNYQYTSALMGKRLKLFFAQLFLFISSVSTEQSQIWRIQNLQCKNGEIWIDRAIWPIVCADKFIHESTYTFDRWSCARRSIAEVQRTSGKAITTNSCDLVLYWCRIPGNGWCRTVLHDKRHWRILTIHRFSGLSWVHLAKRRRFIWTKRLDSREHQDWTRIESYNLLLTR